MIPSTPYAQLFLDQLPLIDHVIQSVARRQRLWRSEWDEFASITRIRLMEHDYRILRRFQGRSSLRTFLTVVITRQCLDYRASLLGKWRPSAEARRLGPIAIRLERLLMRDGVPFDDACRMLRRTCGASVTDASLSDLRARLPRRFKRRFVNDVPFDDMHASTPTPDDGLRRHDAYRLRRQLRRAVARLDARDRSVIRHRFVDGLSVGDTARAIGVEVSGLYHRMPLILRRLRRDLELDGISRPPS